MKKKIIIIIIVIIISIVLIISGILLLKNIGKPQTIVTKIPKDDQEIFTEKVLSKVYLLDANISKEYPIDDFQKMDDTKKTKFLLDILSTSNKEISVADVEKEAKEYFDTFNIVKKNIKDGDLVAYNYKNNTYTKGLSTGSRCIIKTELSTSGKENDNYFVKNKYYYITATKKSVEDLEAEIKIYSTKDDCEKTTNELLSITAKSINITAEDYKKIDDKLNTYTYRFSSKYKILSIKSE